MNPVVSIIMPVHNTGKYLEKAVTSVLQQTYTNFELIIVDDSSTDNSISIAKSLEILDSRIILITNTLNCGPAYSRNIGMKLAKGRYIAFLDSDDLMGRSFLEFSLAFLASNNYSFVFSNYYRLSKNKFTPVVAPRKVNYNDLLKGCVINTNTVVLDSLKFKKFRFPTTTKREDYALWLSLLKNIDYAYNCQIFQSYYRIHNHQNSRRKIKMAMENWKLYRIEERLSFGKSLYYFGHYAVLGFIKKFSPRISNFIYKLY